MAQSNPQPTPMTGNPVLTTNTITALVALIVFLVRTRGGDVTQDQQNALVEVLSGPFGEILVGVVWGAMTWVARSRVYSEMSVKLLTGLKRPAVQ